MEYWDDEDDDPWEDREWGHVVRNNIPEIGMMSLWLEPFNSQIRSASEFGITRNTDYVVIRMDSWAEGCIDPEFIEKAVEYNNQIIKDTKDFYRPTTDIIYSGDCLIDIAKNNINILQNGSEEK